MSYYILEFGKISSIFLCRALICHKCSFKRGVVFFHVIFDELLVIVKNNIHLDFTKFLSSSDTYNFHSYIIPQFYSN